MVYLTIKSFLSLFAFIDINDVTTKMPNCRPPYVTASHFFHYTLSPVSPGK